MAMKSLAVTTDQFRQSSELWLDRHRQVGERFPEPLLLQLGKPSVFLLLGDESVEVVQQILVALGDRPSREGWPRYRLSELEDGGLLGDECVEVDDGVDDVVHPAERQILVGFGI